MHEPQRPDIFATRAHAAFKRGGRRRLLGAAVATLVLLLLLVVLGPEQAEIKQRFEHYGAPGELHIMPEISIVEGRDARQQVPKSLQQPPPPAAIIVEDEPRDPRATETAPKPRQETPSESVPLDLAADADEADRDQVELSLPQQRNPDWYILHQVRPEYPLDAPERERRLPTVFVRAAIFVGKDGRVLEKMVLATNGGPTYSAVVLEALGEWVFGWRVDPGAGRWIEMTWNFRSPYFTPAAAARR